MSQEAIDAALRGPAPDALAQIVAHVNGATDALACALNAGKGAAPLQVLLDLADAETLALRARLVLTTEPLDPPALPLPQEFRP